MDTGSPLPGTANPAIGLVGSILCLLSLACPSSQTRMGDDTSVTLDSSTADGGRDGDSTGDGSTTSDGATPAGGLLSALLCGMTEAEVVDASVRVVACDDDPSGSSVAEYVADWEGLQFGGPNPGTRYTCEGWRCLAEATSCADVESCRYLGYTELRSGCWDQPDICDGSIRTVCAGAGYRHAFDCAVVGGTCIDGECDVGGCRIDDLSQTDCSSDRTSITLCGVEDVCPDGCGSTGYGEVFWGICGGESGLLYGYTECRDRVLHLRTLHHDDLTYDCVANGYSRCNANGCVL
jgi:hypothetical protein